MSDFDLRYDNASPANGYFSSCGINVSPYLYLLSYWKEKLRSHDISLDPADRVLVVLICDQQVRNGVENVVNCFKVYQTLHVNLGFAVAFSRDFVGLERSTVGYMSFQDPAKVSGFHDLYIKETLNVLCAVGPRNVATGNSITTTTSTIRSMLPLLSSCDPLHDLCDAENELYCNPVEYECRYLPSTTATASTATAESNVGAVDTMTTTTATKAAAIIERTSTLAPRRSSPSTTPDPSGGDDADSTRAKQILYWCVGGVLIGMVGTVAWKIGCPHIVGCFKRRGVGGGHRYQNHAYEPLAMQAMDRYRDYYSPADTTNADNNAGTSDSSDQEHRMADETSNETNGSDTSLLNCNVHNERNIYSVDDSSNENTDGSDDSDDSDDSDGDDRSLVDIRRNIFVS